MFYLDKQGISHRREVYTAIDALGDMGGIIEITLIAFGLVLLPISRHSFYLKAARLMFFARTKDCSLFSAGNEKLNKKEKLAKYMDHEGGDHEHGH